jgi:putative AlgH/UPF0301 family transcriptional regulator
MNTDKKQTKKAELTPEQKALKAQKNRRDGYLLIFLALLMFAVGAYFRESESAHHKLLVNQGSGGKNFEQTVIMMVRHDGLSAYGLIVNRPDEKNPGYFYGGPVQPDRISALYTGVDNFEGGQPLSDTGIYYVEGERAEELRKLDPPPPWFIVLRGYSGWSKRQLDREILREWWKLADVDLPVVTETDPEFIWRAVSEKIAAAEEAAKRGITPEELEEKRKKPSGL